MVISHQMTTVITPIVKRESKFEQLITKLQSLGKNMTNSTPAVIAIGLDSADPKLLKKWSDAGDLPNIARLRQYGIWGKLSTPPGLADDAAWSSFYTSCTPSNNGRYTYLQLETGSYRNLRMTGLPLHRPPFWDALGRAGKKTAILDVPKCPLSSEVNGVQLADWYTHGRDYDGPVSQPPGLDQRILEKYGQDETDRAASGNALCMQGKLAPENYPRFEKLQLNSIRNKTELALNLLDNEAWDMFLVVFKESHCSTHQFWHLVDETNPKHGMQSAVLQDTPLKRIYTALDESIGEIITKAGPKTTVIVFSNLGMAANYTADYMLESILSGLLDSKWLQLWNNFYYRHIDHSRGLIRRCMLAVNVRLNRYKRAFQLTHNEISGAIRVNVQGREPHGIVAPGNEYEKFCDALENDLLALVCPDTGLAVVDSVIRPVRDMPGNYVDCLPDLLAIWNRKAEITAAASEKLSVVRQRLPNLRTGNHIPGGFYTAIGPKLIPGQQIDANLMDFAPTIAALLGVDLPDVDGKPLKL